MNFFGTEIAYKPVTGFRLIDELCEIKLHNIMHL